MWQEPLFARLWNVGTFVDLQLVGGEGCDTNHIK